MNNNEGINYFPNAPVYRLVSERRAVEGLDGFQKNNRAFCPAKHTKSYRWSNAIST